MKWYLNLLRESFMGCGWKQFACRMAIIWLHAFVATLCIILLAALQRVLR